MVDNIATNSGQMTKKKKQFDANECQSNEEWNARALASLYLHSTFGCSFFAHGLTLLFMNSTDIFAYRPRYWSNIYNIYSFSPCVRRRRSRRYCFAFDFGYPLRTLCREHFVSSTNKNPIDDPEKWKKKKNNKSECIKRTQALHSMIQNFNPFK